MEKVRENQNELANARDIAEIIEISTERTSVILSNMDGIEPVGENRNRMYKFKISDIITLVELCFEIVLIYI